MGVLSGVSAASQPTMKEYNPDEEGYQFKYEGPYRTIPRKFDPRVEGEGEIQFFDEVNPIGYLTASGERRGYAEGGYIDDPNNPLREGNPPLLQRLQTILLAALTTKYLTEAAEAAVEAAAEAV